MIQYSRDLPHNQRYYPELNFRDAFTSFDEEKTSDIRWIFVISGTLEYSDIREIVTGQTENKSYGSRQKAGPPSYMKKKVPVITVDNNNAVTVQKEVFQTHIKRIHDMFADMKF